MLKEDKMKKKRFTEEQIHGILKESAAGMKADELARKYGIHPNTLSRWKSKYDGMELSDIKKMKILEEENHKLKRLVADQALNIQALELVLGKKW